MTAIQVQNISKRYYLGDRLPNSLRDLATKILKFRGSSSKDEFWALKDLSFDVGEGETLGIIGRNGAGKSTLLKVLSRITKPTSGLAKIQGRVGSLLEVGTGFHNELTGRENIYMNGAILGMKRAEIARKFDEIVAFSEIEQFLDTPVKHYSSGMYMRLAFSIAAHLEPEVLIVDEVLAVGDAAFQKKCLGKMREVGEKGRTVIFVSHDMNAVTRLCDRVIWIENGRLKLDGDTRNVVGEYLHQQTQVGAERRWPDISTAPGNDVVRLTQVRVCDADLTTISTVDIRRPVIMEMTYQLLRDNTELSPNFQLYDERGACIFVTLDQEKKWQNTLRKSGLYMSRAWIPGNLLAEGSIFITVVIATLEPLDVHLVENETVTFQVVDQIEGDSARGEYVGLMPGLVRPILEWETEIIEESV